MSSVGPDREHDGGHFQDRELEAQRPAHQVSRNTSNGATKIAICIDEPTAIASARSIWFRIAI